MHRSLLGLVALLSTSACKDVTEKDTLGANEGEVITTVALTLTPDDGGAPIEATWADPENDGDPLIDALALVMGVNYALDIAFFNELESPAEDITTEVNDESDEHQVFLTGSAVAGPATGDNAAAVVLHAYADTDANGLPIGLHNDLQTLQAGAGDLIVTLRHMPPESESAVKVAGAAETVATGGFSAIGGDNDAQVTFALSVQ